MIDLFPRCVKWNCDVTDSMEPEVEKGTRLKLGRYVGSVSGRQKVWKSQAADISLNTL